MGHKCMLYVLLTTGLYNQAQGFTSLVQPMQLAHTVMTSGSLYAGGEGVGADASKPRSVAPELTCSKKS